MDSQNSDKNVVSYLAFESVMARWERSNKRLIIIIGVLIALLFASNCAWLMFMCGADFESYEVDADAGQGEIHYNYIGEDGDINNGTNEGQSAEDNSERSKRQDNKKTGQNG